MTHHSNFHGLACRKQQKILNGMSSDGFAANSLDRLASQNIFRQRLLNNDDLSRRKGLARRMLVQRESGNDIHEENKPARSLRTYKFTSHSVDHLHPFLIESNVWDTMAIDRNKSRSGLDNERPSWGGYSRAPSIELTNYGYSNTKRQEEVKHNAYFSPQIIDEEVSHYATEVAKTD